MKINAVYDREGRILAASVSGGDYDGPMPVPGEGEQADIFEVPDGLAKSTLADICLGLRVDSNSNSLVGETRAQG